MSVDRLESTPPVGTIYYSLTSLLISSPIHSIYKICIIIFTLYTEVRCFIVFERRGVKEYYSKREEKEEDLCSFYIILKMESTAGEKVAVYVRARPLLGKELEHDDVGCLTFEQSRTSVGVDGRRRHGSKHFTFDRVFHPDTTQDMIYTEAARGLVDGVFQGYNTTIMGYGQTGSGKTYTMGTSETIETKHNGIVPRFLKDLFAKKKDMEETHDVVFKAQLIEIYNSQIIDLLRLDDGEVVAGSRKIRVLQGEVIGVQTEPIASYTEAMDCLVQGLVNRKVESNNVNEDSSRSHAIFTILMEAKAKSGVELAADQADEFTAKITFVDLAGSERLSKTKSEGDRRKEGININKGLLELGRVINVLADPQSNGLPPYRNSTLTLVLQDALGGNSRTVFIACISPAKEHASETESTLGYANNVKRISNKVVLNISQSTRQLMEMRKQRDAALRAFAAARFGFEDKSDAEIDTLMAETKVKDAVAEIMRKACVNGTLSVAIATRPKISTAWTGSTNDQHSSATSFAASSNSLRGAGGSARRSVDDIVCVAARKESTKTHEEDDSAVDDADATEQIEFLDKEISDLQIQSAKIESDEEDVEMVSQEIAEKVRILETLKYTIEEEMPKLKTHIEQLTEQHTLQELEREKLVHEIQRKEQEMEKSSKAKVDTKAKARLVTLRDQLKKKNAEIDTIAGKLKHSKRHIDRMKRQHSERERLESDVLRLKQKRAGMVREIKELKKSYEARQRSMTLKMNKMSKTLSKQKRKMDTMARKQEQIIQTKDRLQARLSKKEKQLKAREAAIKKLCSRRVQMRTKRYRSDAQRKSGEHKYEAAAEQYKRQHVRITDLRERLKEIRDDLEELDSYEELDAESEQRVKENREALGEEASWLRVEIENIKGKMETFLESSVNKLQVKEARKMLIQTIRKRVSIEVEAEVNSRRNAKRFATVKKQRDEERRRAEQKEALNRTLQKKLKRRRIFSGDDENDFESPTKRRRRSRGKSEDTKESSVTPYMQRKRWANSLRDTSNTENVRRNDKTTSQKGEGLDQMRFEFALKRQKMEQQRIEEMETEKEESKRRQTMGMASVRSKSRGDQKRDGDNFLSHAKREGKRARDRRRQSLLGPPRTVKASRKSRRQSTGALGPPRRAV